MWAAHLCCDQERLPQGRPAAPGSTCSASGLSAFLRRHVRCLSWRPCAWQVLAALESLQRSIDRDEPEESVVALPEGGPVQPGSGTAGGAPAATAAGGQPAATRQAMQVG